MHKSLRFAPKRGLIAALTGLALVLAACGSSQDAAVEVGAEAPTVDAAQSDEAEADPAQSDEAPADEAESNETESNETESDETESEEAEPEAAVENVFPDIEVLNIADGSSVNLATELGGGDLPVLLWFWAPH